MIFAFAEITISVPSQVAFLAEYLVRLADPARLSDAGDAGHNLA
jgi:hypothetical protein